MDPACPDPQQDRRPGRAAGLTSRPLARLAALLAALLLALVVLPTAAASAATGGPEPVRAIPSIAPIAPAGAGAGATAGKGAGAGAGVGSSLDIRNGKGGLTQPVSLALLLGALSLVPGLLIMVTAFTRIVIVLGLTRSALGTQGTPPNQVLIGLALFLTLFVMSPYLARVNTDAVQPYLKEQITATQAFDRGVVPFKDFMLKQAREQDIALFVQLSDSPAPKNPQSVPLTTLVPAYVISELRAAFLIGFVIFLPFLVIDLVVSAALSAMGMAMLPPSLISLPFKLLLFVAVDGWALLAQSLVRSFH